MPRDSGFIKVWRRMVEHPLFKAGRTLNAPLLGAWVDILLTVAWRAHIAHLQGTRVEVKPGQMLFTYRGLGRRWGMDKNTAKVVVRKFEAEGMVRIAFCTHHKIHHDPHHDPHHGVMLLTVVHWRRWQGDGKTSSPRTSPRHSPRTSPLSEEEVEEGVSEEVKKNSPINEPLAELVTRGGNGPDQAAEREDEMQDIPEIVTEERDIIKAAAACVADFQRTLPSGARAKLAPPSKRDFDRLMQLIVANAGRWAEVSAGIVGITREAVGRKKDVGSIAYPIQVWLARAPEREVARAIAEAAAAGPDERVERLVADMAKQMQLAPERDETQRGPVAPAAKPETPEERKKREAWQAQYRAEREADAKKELSDAERKRISEMARETIERLTH